MQLQDVISPAEFQQIKTLVYEQCGINLHEGKTDLVRARILKRLRAKNCSTVKEYLQRVEADKTGAEIAGLLDEMSTNLTSFFRESEHFNFLKGTHLPNLLELKKKKSSNKLRFWSAACSSGQEPYTLAMTLAAAIPNFQQWDLKLLATDISTRMLAIAERGRYDAIKLREIPSTYHNFLHSSGKGDDAVFDIAPALKSLIRFRRLNLVGPWPFSGQFDVIFCRNVMIYFDTPTKMQLIDRFTAMIRPGGFLYIGHSESLNGVHPGISLVGRTIYRRTA